MAIGRTIRDEFDWPLFIAVSTIALFGVLNLYSATDGGTTSEAYIQQLYWLVLGFGVAGITAAIDYRHFERYGWLIYGACVLALLLVFVLGQERSRLDAVDRARRFSLQPSELMKIGLIIALAKYLHHDTKTGGRTLADLIIPGLILALPMTLVLIQPDLGTAMILAFIFASIMMLTQLKLRSVVTLIATFVVAAPGHLVLSAQGLPKRADHRVLGSPRRHTDRPARFGLAHPSIPRRDRQRRAHREGLHPGHADAVSLLARPAHRFPVPGLGRGARLRRRAAVDLPLPLPGASGRSASPLRRRTDSGPSSPSAWAR